MRHAAVHGPEHHHSLHEMAIHAGKTLHQPGFWVAAGLLLIVLAVVVLTLVYGVPAQPEGWDSYMWAPF